MRRFVGTLLRGVRAGEKHLAYNDPAAANAPLSLVISSSSFEFGGTIPRKHAGPGEGENISPELSWMGVPPETAELVLIVEDPDAPLPRPFVHALATGIPPGTLTLAEGRLSETNTPGDGLSMGKNTFGKTTYGGPRPVPGHGPHTYVFQLFAIDKHLAFEGVPSRADVLRQMEGAVIARGRIEGTYER